MCKVFITNEKELSNLEVEAINAKFRKDPNKKHKVIFCQDSRAMVIAARYDTPMSSTKKTIQFMRSLYKPKMIEVVAMSRIAA